MRQNRFLRMTMILRILNKPLSRFSVLFLAVILLLSGNVSAQTEFTSETKIPADSAVLLEFTASWCGPCKQMRATTLKDSSVLDLIDSNFLWLEVNTDVKFGKDLAARFKINQYPTFIVWDPKSDEVLLRLIGYKPVEIFSEDLRFSLKYTRFDN